MRRGAPPFPPASPHPGTPAPSGAKVQLGGGGGAGRGSTSGGTGRPTSSCVSSPSFLEAHPESPPHRVCPGNPLGKGDPSPPSDVQREFPKRGRLAPSTLRGLEQGVGHRDLGGVLSDGRGHPLPLAQKAPPPLPPATPREAEEASEPGSPPQGQESAGACPGLTPKDRRATRRRCSGGGGGPWHSLNGLTNSAA